MKEIFKKGTLWKRDSNAGAFSYNSEIFKNIYFDEPLQTTAFIARGKHILFLFFWVFFISFTTSTEYVNNWIRTGK